MNEWKDDLTSVLIVYSVVSDDAIDLVASDIAAYAGEIVNGVELEKGSRNPALITALPGRVLRGAVTIAMPMALGVQIDSLTSHHLRCLQAFRACVTAVENLPSSGMRLGPTTDLRLADGRSHLTWSDDELDALQSLMGREFMYEIGAVILERSNLGKARSGAQLYTPQLFLEPALTKTASLIAEQRKASCATPSNDSPPDDSTPRPGETSAAPGDAPAESGVTVPAV